MNTSSRSLYWDIVKGFGIIAIVLGHAGLPGGAFVYLFHLALFFFVTGYFYNEKKYGDNPFLYLGARLAGFWPRYCFYVICFVLLHNTFVISGIQAGQPLYNHTAMLTNSLSSLSFTCPEQLLGALWFLMPWLISSAVFGGTVWFGRTATKRLNCRAVKMPVIIFSSLMVGVVGVFLNMRQASLPYNLHTALLAVPLCFWLPG